MTKKETIKVLQSIEDRAVEFPNMTECDWVAIAAAKRHLQEPVSEELEEACEQLAENARKHKAETSSPFFSQTDYKQGIIDGAKWKVENLWKPADGEDLPEYEREVIVLTQPYPLEGSEFAVSFAHRPDPKGWDGKSITTGKIEHYTPKTYGKGDWNIPDVKYWLDCSMPKEIEL